MTSPIRVIAVSGPPGSGKSSLAVALARRLGGAPVVSYDSYEQITGRPAAEVEGWLTTGADIGAIPVPGLVEDLASLKSGEAVPDRAGGRSRRAMDFVVFDTLIGKAHPPTAGLIDALLWIDLPLDIALARKIRRTIADERGRRGRRDFDGLTEWLDGYLAHYQRFVRKAYLMQRVRVAPGADHVLDGQMPAETVAERAEAFVRQLYPIAHEGTAA